MFQYPGLGVFCFCSNHGRYRVKGGLGGTSLEGTFGETLYKGGRNIFTCLCFYHTAEFTILKRNWGRKTLLTALSSTGARQQEALGLLYYFAHTYEVQNSIYVNTLRLRRNELPQDPLSKFLSSGFSRSRNYRCNDINIVNACGRYHMYRG